MSRWLHFFFHFSECLIDSINFNAFSSLQKSMASNPFVHTYIDYINELENGEKYEAKSEKR